MQEKRLRKEKYLAEELDSYPLVKTYGENKSSTALLCWGSNKGVCVELAEKLGLKIVQPLVLNPFPLRQFQEALAGVTKIIAVENNATGQLVKLVSRYGFKIDEKILKYDGRPFALDELEYELTKVLE
jgi:2-oxoglutarate ferredoxin oxidoreductase subunit alpha